MLTIANGYKKFGQQSVLQNIELTLSSQTIIGLAGGSGSGKTTLLRCIQGLDVLDEGMIELTGNCGFMFQDFQLFPHMTVLDNLVYAAHLVDKKSDHCARAKQLLKKLGIEDKTKSYPHQLSGGQKQRVALARCLMLDPELLLCDEPTSGLDIATIQEVASLLLSVKALGMTILVASHDLAFLSKICDRVVVLKEGKIAADVQVTNSTNALLDLETLYLANEEQKS